jgi:hypothetical protein
VRHVVTGESSYRERHFRNVLDQSTQGPEYRRAFVSSRSGNDLWIEYGAVSLRPVAIYRDDDGDGLVDECLAFSGPVVAVYRASHIYGLRGGVFAPLVSRLSSSRNWSITTRESGYPARSTASSGSCKRS